MPAKKRGKSPPKPKAEIKKNHYAITVERRWFAIRKGLKAGPLFSDEVRALKDLKTRHSAPYGTSIIASAWFVLEGGVPCIHEVIEGQRKYPVGFAGYQSEEEAKRVAKSYYETYAKNPNEYTVTKSLELS